MNELSVGLDSYLTPGTNTGESSQAELNELQKALEAGSITGGASLDSATDSGAPLKVESLEGTLKVITWKESDIQLWKKVPKLPAYNTVEEYNQLVSYGEDGMGGFNAEGELPQEADSVYTRRAQLVKFMGVTGSVTHPMQLVTTMIGDVLQQEIKNKIQWLLKKADVALAYGDADIISQQFNGFYKQHKEGVMGSTGTLADYYASDNVVNMEGNILSEDGLEDASLGIIENFGYADLLMASPEVLSGFVKNFYDSKYITPNTPSLTDAVMGQRVKTFMSQFGEVELSYDKFLKKSRPRAASAAALTTVNPLAAPTVTGAAVTSTDYFYLAGDVNFCVAAVNRYGEGAMSAALGGAVTVTLADAVDLTVSQVTNATGYIVYQTEVDGTILYPVLTISETERAAGYGGGAAGLIRVDGRILAKTEEAFLIENSSQVWSFKQLAPLMKMDLAVLAPAQRFMILLYGTPQLYAPKKLCRIYNIGSATP